MGFNKTLSRFLTIAGFYTALTACSSNQPTVEPDLPEKEYFRIAQEALENNLPTTAAEQLKELETRYPFGEYTIPARLDLIYAQFEAGNYAAAHATADRFIKNYPDHVSIDYAYYMRGLSTYRGAETFLGRYLDLNAAERDTAEFDKAFAEFADFLRRFPDSNFAPDAKARMVYLRNLIAEHEISIAHYYFKRKAPLSALRRGQEVVQSYPSTPAVEEALAITIQAYMDLGLYDEAKLNLSVLANSFPNSEFLDKDKKFIPFELPREADPDLLYWVSLGLIN
ncbi:Outer membrane protein assembly factor BamD precursor [Marinomonas aquimarina]|uniref:Outer membrane protein assembly factor BamD n=1 Tax=Marinomonas aquimarina TaxID=295068 RepID=A0A1A8T0Q1_9GAMM|nr:outer membrane protein assembly factor BamD [Marinomonas aquimarina]SBS24696.1 Outer membrane protein assembly factor BamD precursor [Marinomonas aquimarina]